MTEVQELMVQNLELLLERGERIETLVDKTDKLQDSALLYKKGARKLETAMWWKNMRWWIIVFLIIIWLTRARPRRRSSATSSPGSSADSHTRTADVR